MTKAQQVTKTEWECRIDGQRNTDSQGRTGAHNKQVVDSGQVAKNQLVTTYQKFVYKPKSVNYRVSVGLLGNNKPVIVFTCVFQELHSC